MKLVTNCASVLIVVGVAPIAASQPLVAQAKPSHAHVGHVSNAWSDTPEGAGLLPTAVSEAEIAATHAALAVKARDLAGIQAHIGHVMHAVDPTTVESGPGKGYGVLKATQGVVTHINLAAGSAGASDYLKLHAEHVATSANNVAEWGAVALDKARAARETSDQAQAAQLAQEIQALCTKILNGYDENKDGRISWGPSEGGLEQAVFHLNLLRRGEGIDGER